MNFEDKTSIFIPINFVVKMFQHRSFIDDLMRYYKIVSFKAIKYSCSTHHKLRIEYYVQHLSMSNCEGLVTISTWEGLLRKH